MADSAFWRELAAQFLAIPDHQRLAFSEHSPLRSQLRAERIHILGSDMEAHWALLGTANSVAQFQALAGRGASAIANAGTSDLWVAWLEALMAHDKSVFHRGTFTASESWIDGRHPLTGSVLRLREASANFCKALEYQALETELTEKLRHESSGHLLGDDSPNPVPPSPAHETIAAQLQRLRDECHITEEELAEKIDMDIRSVQRHLASKTIPRARHLRVYERVFSKLLNRQIVIRKMP